MPKIKTRKSAQKRFHITGTGKIMRAKIGKSHLRRKKPHRTKRQYAKLLPLHPSEEAAVKRQLPYGVK